MSKEVEKALEEYRERFGEYFPLMLAQGMSDAQIIREVNACLKSGKEYEPDAPGDALF